MSEASNVLCHNDIGPTCSNNSQHFRPEVSIIIACLSSASSAEWLTRKAAANDVWSVNVVFSSAVTGKPPRDKPAALSNVTESLYIWPMFLQHLSAKWVYLYLPNRLDSGPFKAKIKSANSGKKRTMRERLHLSSPPSPLTLQKERLFPGRKQPLLQLPVSPFVTVDPLPQAKQAYHAA